MSSIGKGISYRVFLQKYRRYCGKDAFNFNLLAVISLTDSLKSSFGPFGRDKLVLGENEFALAKDGFTILNTISPFSPVITLLKDSVKNLKETVGDGTLTAILLVGELLKKAVSLIVRGIPSSKIIKGYSLACKEALNMFETLSHKFKIEDSSQTQKIIYTVLHGSGLTDVEIAESKLCNLIQEAVYTVLEKSEDGVDFDLDQVKVMGLKEGFAEQSMLVKGVVFKSLSELHLAMPRRIVNPKILLVNSPIGVEKPYTATKIELTTPESLGRVRDYKVKSVLRFIDRVKQLGVNVVFCSRKIDDISMSYFAKNDILAVPNLSNTDIRRLSNATYARPVFNLENLQKSDLGQAEIVEERRFGRVKRIFVECKNPKAVTIFLLGATKRATVATRKALKAISTVIRKPRVLVGCGAIEMEVAQRLKSYALKLEGKEQLAALAFADALESLPLILASNSGINPLDALVKLRELHKHGKSTAGFDVEKGKMVEKIEKWIEPLEVKSQVLKSAVETTSVILSLDDILVNMEILKQ